MRKAVGWSMLAFVSGCAPVGPDYRQPQPAVPASWQEAPVVVAPAANVASGRWWGLFGDPQLDALITSASAGNLDLKQAEARIREARAARMIAAATGSVSASGEVSHSRKSENSSSNGSENLFQIGFDAAWELDIFGGVRRAVEEADAVLAASIEDQRDVLVSLQAEVARNYLELRGSQKRLATARRNIATQEETVELVRGRHRMGLGNELDVVQAQAQLALTRAQVPVFESSVHQAMHRLALLLGQNPGSLVTELSPAKDIRTVLDLIPVELPSELLRQRPDIRAAERRLAAATADIGVATADLFPRFSLPASVGLQSTSLGNLISVGSRYWSAGPVIDLAIFNQGKVRAGIEISKARRDSALAEYQRTVLTAFAEVEDGLVAFARERETLQILGEAVAKSDEAVAMANGLFETGLTNFLNVLQSEQILYHSEDELAQSEERLGLALVAIYKALGGGWRHAGENPAAEAGMQTDDSPSNNSGNEQLP